MDKQGQNQDPNTSKQDKTKQNTKNALQAAEKGVGAVFGGSAGIAAVNAAHNAPVIGKAINKTEDKIASRLSQSKLVGGVANELGDSGITDAANKGLDTVGAVVGGGAGAASSGASAASSAGGTMGSPTTQSTSNPVSKSNTNRNPLSNISLNSNSSYGEEESNSSGELFSLEKLKKFKKIASIILGAFSIILTITFIIAIFSVFQNRIIDSATEWVETGKERVASFFEKFDNFLRGNGWANDETAFLNSLNNKTEYYSKKNIQLNVPLIMSTLLTKRMYISNNLEDDMGAEFENIDETQTDVNEIRFGSMIGDMRKLAEYQVAKFFSLPSDDNPGVYETVINPPLATLNAIANLLNVTVDTLFPSNMKLSNANYLSNLRFGKSASKDAIDAERAEYSTSVGSSSGEIRLTNYIDNQVGWNNMSPYGNMKERFRLNEKGWWMYKDPDTGMEYLAIAAPTIYCLGNGCEKRWAEIPGITYYEYGDIIPLNIAGENYQAMVIDSCGACMTATNPLKIDVYVSRDYFSENGLTSAGLSAGAVTPDDLTTTMGSIQNKPTQDCWQYVEPTQSEKQDVSGYKNGYIYKTYTEAFEGLDDSAIPNKVEEIIKTIYNMKDSYAEYSNLNSGSGNTSDTISGERTSRPKRTNSFYYDQTSDSGVNGTLEGECAWYATGRAAEFLSSINSPETWTDNVNGGDFCNTSDAQKFNTGTTPKAGSLISWGYEPYGHVAFVESVNADGTFNITEAAISFGQWGKSARSIINSGNNSQLRKENCEGNGTGCFNIQKNITTSAYSNFKCFIYLTEPKNGGNANE